MMQQQSQQTKILVSTGGGFGGGGGGYYQSGLVQQQRAPSKQPGSHIKQLASSLDLQNRALQLICQQRLVNEAALEAVNQPGSAAAAAAAATRYKTELCRSYQENGTCKYGDKCQFAHGCGELRSMSRHPKYKTELCRTFHAAGYCPYGPRCHFVHDTEQQQLRSAAARNSLALKLPTVKSTSSAGSSSSSSSSSSTSPLCSLNPNQFRFDSDEEVTGFPVSNSLLMCASDFGSSSSSSSSAEISPPSSRSLSPDSFHFNKAPSYEEDSTATLVTQILNNLNLSAGSTIEQLSAIHLLATALQQQCAI